MQTNLKSNKTVLKTKCWIFQHNWCHESKSDGGYQNTTEEYIYKNTICEIWLPKLQGKEKRKKKRKG